MRTQDPGGGGAPGVLADARNRRAWALGDWLLYTLVPVLPAPLAPPDRLLQAQPPQPGLGPAAIWPARPSEGARPPAGGIKKDVSFPAADMQGHQLLKRFIGRRARNCFYSNVNISKGKRKKVSRGVSLSPFYGCFNGPLIFKRYCWCANTDPIIFLNNFFFFCW